MNISILAEELGLEEEDARRLVLTFLEATEKDLLLLAQAFSETDSEKARATAHHVKGAAASLELNEIAGAAAAIEDKARSGIIEDPAEPIQLIRDRLELVRTQISAKQ